MAFYCLACRPRVAPPTFAPRLTHCTAPRPDGRPLSTRARPAKRPADAPRYAPAFEDVAKAPGLEKGAAPPPDWGPPRHKVFGDVVVD